MFFFLNVVIFEILVSAAVGRLSGSEGETA
jgi:hypothetical protein